MPFAFPSVVVSNVFCSLLKTLCSGSTISSVYSDKVKSNSRLIWAETFPAPTIGVIIEITLLRYIFSNLIGLSAFSGLKSVELGQLSYEDFFLRDEILCCNIESSRGYRVVEFDSEAKTYIKNLRNLRVEELGLQPPDNEKILYNERINRAPLNTSKSLISLLGFAKINIFKNGIKRNVSSFRNLYAYKAIKKGLPDHFIANQLNVSLRTVHDYRMSFANFTKDEINLEENKSKKSTHSQINWREF